DTDELGHIRPLSELFAGSELSRRIKRCDFPRCTRGRDAVQPVPRRTPQLPDAALNAAGRARQNAWPRRERGHASSENRAILHKRPEKSIRGSVERLSSEFASALARAAARS